MLRGNKPLYESDEEIESEPHVSQHKGVDVPIAGNTNITADENKTETSNMLSGRFGKKFDRTESITDPNENTNILGSRFGNKFARTESITEPKGNLRNNKVGPVGLQQVESDEDENVVEDLPTKAGPTQNVKQRESLLVLSGDSIFGKNTPTSGLSNNAFYKEQDSKRNIPNANDPIDTNSF